MSYLAPILVAAAVVITALVGLRAQPASPAVSPLPTTADDIASTELPTAEELATPTPEARALGVSTWLPLPSVEPLFTSPRPTPVSSPSPVHATGELAISFVNVPERVRVGESFTIRWAVTGPPGRVGQSTTLAALFAKKTESGGSSSSITSNTSQSSGAFTVPAQFDRQFSFGGTPGEVKLTATAEISGETLTTTRTIELAE